MAEPQSEQVKAGRLAYTSEVLDEVYDERGKQLDKWGEQNYHDGTARPGDAVFAETARAQCELEFALGTGTWRHILAEELCEAFAESDPERLRAELLQVAAVAVAWVEAIDRRHPGTERGTRSGGVT